MNENITVVRRTKNDLTLARAGGNCYKQPIKFSRNINRNQVVRRCDVSNRKGKGEDRVCS